MYKRKFLTNKTGFQAKQLFIKEIIKKDCLNINLKKY